MAGPPLTPEQAAALFRVRLQIVYATAGAVGAAMIFCVYLIMQYKSFPMEIVRAAYVALFTTILGALLWSYKLIIRKLW